MKIIIFIIIACTLFVVWSLCIVGASADEQLKMIYAKDLERKEQREKLSRVIQCDRCRKTYEKNERYQTRGSVEGSVLSGITTITGMGLRDESYDLCDKCIGGLLAEDGSRHNEGSRCRWSRDWKKTISRMRITGRKNI